MPREKLPLLGTKEGILARVMPEPNSGCWLWTMNGNEYGYGTGFLEGKTIGAHRLSYMIFKGDPTGWCVLHKCDTPACVNPDHLRLGTLSENARDMAIKGRQKRSKLNLIKGCWFAKREKKWLACISRSRFRVHLGCFNTEQEARQALIDFRNIEANHPGGFEFAIKCRKVKRYTHGKIPAKKVPRPGEAYLPPANVPGSE